MERAEQVVLGEVFHMMAVLFYDPSEVFVGEEKDLFTAYEPAVATWDHVMHKLFLSLQSAAGKADLTELRVDYAALFVGPYELLACPYGSVHLEKERQLYGATTREVEKMYAEAGLQMGQDTGTIPDHIAVELEFLHYLLHQAVTVDSSLPASLYQRFLHGYFGPFAKKLAEDIIQRAGTDFYRLLGEMLSRLTVTALARENISAEAV